MIVRFFISGYYNNYNVCGCSEEAVTHLTAAHPIPFFQWICGFDGGAAGRQLPTQCLRSCFYKVEFLYLLFRNAILLVDLWCGSLACCGKAIARACALGAVKEAIAYSMAALLLAGKLGTFI